MPASQIPFPESPRFQRRGLMLDISRNRIPTMAYLKWLIDRMAELRYNELQLYTEHSFAYTEHPTVWQDASPMTAGEIQELDRYCAERGIELVPNQNSFGHMERWLKHPPYKQLAECPDGFEHPIAGWKATGSTLFPSKESAAFIDALYAELLPNFNSKQLHIGGDEPWELGKGRSSQTVELIGKHRVYLDFLNQLFEIARKRGCKAQFWADIILERPDLVPELPRDVTPVIWGYEADSPFAKNCRIVAEAGFAGNFYVAPGAGNWNSFSGRLDVASQNIALAAEEGYATGASGLLLTAWGDNGHHQPWPTLYAPLIIASLESWGLSYTPDQLAQWIDQLFYPDAPTGNGAALCQLGQIDAIVPQPAPPNSFLHSIFFAGTQNTSTKTYATEQARIEQIEALLSKINAEACDPEIQLSIALTRAALFKATHAENWETQSQNQSAEFAQLKENFRHHWLQKSRPGGLEDSLTRLDSYLT